MIAAAPELFDNPPTSLTFPHRPLNEPDADCHAVFGLSGYLAPEDPAAQRLARIQASQWCCVGGSTAALQARRNQSHPE